MMSTTRRVFQIPVANEIYHVWDRPDTPHGGDDPKTWWIYMGADDLPEGVCPPADSPHWHPYSSHIPRRNYEITFSQRTSTKYKWDALQFSSNTVCSIKCNGSEIYRFLTIGGQHGLSFAMAKAQYLIVHLSEHCFNFHDPQSENGRKIYWKGLPATVKVWREDSPWEIGIVPDYTEIPKDRWWRELAERERVIGGEPDPDWDDIDQDADGMESDFINWGDALSDQHINWFRK